VRPDPDTLFFVISTGRCGSTLLQAMLSSHPRLYIPPELRYFGRHDPGASFTDPLRDEDVEAYLTACKFDIWWGDMGLDHAEFAGAVRGGVRSGRDIYLWVMGHVGEKRGNRKPRYGEKTTYYALHGDRIAELFPRAQFIHVYRDPRDVAASYLEQYWCSKGTALGCARHIKRTYDHADRLASHVGPARFTTVRYEDLVADSERELRRLCAFLGEDYDPAMLRHQEAASTGFLEVEEGWKGMTRESLTSSRIGRYAAKLDPRQIWMVERTLGDALRGHGYEPTARHPGPLHWRAAFWGERLYRGVLWSVLGIGRPLLDEEAVLARRNELFAQRRATPVKT
jgi:sulfotransferase family protein